MRLAADIAYDITASQTVAAQAEQKFAALMQAARLADAQESMEAKSLSWLESRL
jgi:hypothetical protein